MKFPSHGHLSLDQWRQDLESFGAGDFDKLAMDSFRVASQHMTSNPDEQDWIATFAATAAVFGVNTLATSAILIDGPLPFGDVLGYGLFMIPDSKIYGSVYSMFD